MKLFNTLFLVAAIHFGIHAQKAIVYDGKSGQILVNGTFVEILEDKTNQLTFDEVKNSKAFQPSEKTVPNCGVSKSTFWLRYKVKNESSDEALTMNLSYPNLDEVELHTLYPDTHFVEHMGKYLPFVNRRYNYPSYIFNLNIEPDSTVQLFLKIRSGGQIMAPIYIGDRKEIFESLRSEVLFIGVFSGIMLIMFLYNLFIYFTVRDKVYLYYVGYILTVGLVQLCLLGYTFQLLWPGSTWLAKHSIYLLSALVGISSIEFIKVFLQTKTFTPKLHKGFIVFNLIYLLYIVLDLFNLSADAYSVIQLCAMLLSIYMMVTAYKIAKKGSRPARFFLLAWSIFLAGVFVYALKDVGIIPYNSTTIYLMPIGSAIETALLSFALADRINILKREKEKSDAKALQALKENERIITEQNIRLESKVKERTAELEASNKTLKEAEANLINAEKMASLGQLTAGISHEINNPINFVASNIKPLKRDISEILLMLSKYSDIKDASEFSQKQKELDQLRKELDIDYLTEEINLLLKGIDEGANRTSEIVRGLKTFARADETDLKKINVHEGIDATLGLLNSHFNSAGVKVVKNYRELPIIDCYPGKLNQVFMNLFNNAVHAMLQTNRPKTLTIETEALDASVLIKISDTGKGMPAAILDKIFEPFFTTKDVGEGTGLGLSIVYGIIKNHKGTIKVASKENEGSTFIITLPIALNKNEA
jgi:two-component system, NtrC family, sensor kinase